MRAFLLGAFFGAVMMWSFGSVSPVHSQGAEQPEIEQAEIDAHKRYHDPKNWEYECLSVWNANPKKAAPAVDKMVNEMATQGWNIAETDSMVWCFKRLRK